MHKNQAILGNLPATIMTAAALIDRLLHCHIVNIRGHSYRMREHRDLLGNTGSGRNAQQGNAA